MLALIWIGGYATDDDSWERFGVWLTVLWVSCLVLVPMAVLGAVWAGRSGRRGFMVWAIIAGVLCLPGFFAALTVLPVLLLE